jgi:hypothetical protein
LSRIPSSVDIIEESSFEGCAELESCLIADDSSLVTIGARAFAKCTSLRSFYVPPLVGGIGGACFDKCIHLYRLEFPSAQSLQRIAGDRSLDDVWDELAVSEYSGLFRIEVEDGERELQFPGSTSASGGEVRVCSGLKSKMEKWMWIFLVGFLSLFLVMVKMVKAIWN